MGGWGGWYPPCTQHTPPPCHLHTSTVERTGDEAICVSSGPSRRVDGAMRGDRKGITSVAGRLLKAIRALPDLWGRTGGGGVRGGHRAWGANHVTVQRGERRGPGPGGQTMTHFSLPKFKNVEACDTWHVSVWQGVQGVGGGDGGGAH